MSRWNSCNVLDATGENRQLWQFVPAASGPKQVLEARLMPSEPLPARTVGKDWQALVQTKINIAWFPSHKVFLRAIQLPCNDALEARGMVELQIEKISTIPANQAVWTFELMPGVMGPLRTALVVVAERAFVEEFLGGLEGQGYLADRLEIPFIDRLLALTSPEDGAHLYPGPDTGPQWCLAAWYYNGLLQTIGFLHLPETPETPETRSGLVRDHLRQSAWSGESDGWMTSPPRCHLVAGPETAAVWKPMLDGVFDAPVRVTAPIADAQIAAATVKRTAAADPSHGLMPVEYLTRYRQQLVDRVWMTGLAATLAVYLLGVLLYFAGIQVVQFQYDGLETQFRGAATPYTNAVKLKTQVQVLQEQLDLQFAALECYKAAAELLPESVQLDSMNFSRGKSLTLVGIVPQDSGSKVYDYNEALRNAVDAKGQPLFVKINAVNMSTRGSMISWTFSCDIKQNENE